jgi:hypothetical protein
VVVFAVLLTLRLSDMKEASAEVKTQVMDVLPSMPAYHHDAAYFQSLVEDNHDQAFKVPANNTGIAARNVGKRGRPKYHETGDSYFG